MHTADRIVSILIALAAIVVLVSAWRSRRVQYRDIQASEISPDISAGEDLLHEVLQAESADHSGSR
jgi:hypothetical protein